MFRPCEHRALPLRSAARRNATAQSPFLKAQQKEKDRDKYKDKDEKVMKHVPKA